MAKPTIQIGGGNWAGKTDNLLGYYKEGERFYKQDFTFSRSTTGTYTDKDGYIQEMPPNLITYSQDFSNSNYIKDSGVTIGNTNNISPIGDYTATQINVTNFGRIYQNVTSAEYRTSVYLKAGTFAYFKVVGQNVDLNLGTITSTYPNKIENIGNGWYRISISYIQTIRPFQIQAFPDNTYTTHTTSGNYFVWGAMLNYGDTTKTYFPTTTRLNIPRVDYLNNSNGSLILEPQRSNINTYSSDYTVTAALTRITVSSDYGTSPSGLSDSTAIFNTAANGRHNIGGLYFSVTSGTTYANSVFAKAGTLSKINLRMFSGGGTSIGFNDGTFDLINGTASGTGASIEDYGNGWYRCIVVDSPTSSVSNARYNIELLDDNGSVSYLGSTDEYVEIYGNQVESGSYATTLINTSGSSVTRNADACSITNVADRINSTEGTIYVEMAALANDSTNRYISINNGTSSKRIIFKFGTSSNNISALGLGTASSFNMSYSGATITNINKIALKYKTNDCALWVNGEEVATDSTFTAYAANTLNKITFSNFAETGQFLEANVKNFMLYNTALSNSELATLTT